MEQGPEQKEWRFEWDLDYHKEERMAIQLEAKRVQTGQSLTSFHTQGISAINQLEGIKTNLINLKSMVNSDIDYTTEDTEDVQIVIDDLVSRINVLKG